MKSILPSAVTASCALIGFVLFAATAQSLHLVFESLLMLNTKVTHDPLLLVSAVMLTSILVIGRTLDFLRNRLEHRVNMAAMA